MNHKVLSLYTYTLLNIKSLAVVKLDYQLAKKQWQNGQIYSVKCF